MSARTSSGSRCRSSPGRLSASARTTSSTKNGFHPLGGWRLPRDDLDESRDLGPSEARERYASPEPHELAEEVGSLADARLHVPIGGEEQHRLVGD
jgi:hypothetical protein